MLRGLFGRGERATAGGFSEAWPATRHAIIGEAWAPWFGLRLPASQRVRFQAERGVEDARMPAAILEIAQRQAERAALTLHAAAQRPSAPAPDADVSSVSASRPRRRRSNGPEANRVG